MAPYELYIGLCQKKRHNMVFRLATAKVAKVFEIYGLLEGSWVVRGSVCAPKVPGSGAAPGGSEVGPKRPFLGGILQTHKHDDCMIL